QCWDVRNRERFAKALLFWLAVSAVSLIHSRSPSLPFVYMIQARHPGPKFRRAPPHIPSPRCKTSPCRPSPEGFRPGRRTIILALSLIHPRPQQAAGSVAGGFSMIVDDLAVHDRVLDAGCRHHESDRSAGKIFAHLLTLGGIDRTVVENRY